MAQDSLTITDNRTGLSYEVPITDGTIKALDLRKIKTGDDDFGLVRLAVAVSVLHEEDVR